jgi:integrase
MARETLLITPQVLREALDKAAAGGADAELGDTAVRGLCLRLRGKSAVWAVRGRLGGEGSPKPFRLRDAKPEGMSVKALERELEAVRALATETKALLKRGIDPREALREKELGGAVVKPEPQQPAEDLGPLWREALDGWLEHLLDNGRRLDTVKSYRSCLISPAAVAILGGKRVREISKTDIEAVRDRLVSDGKRRQAQAVIQAAGAMLSWAVGDENNPAARVKKPSAQGRVSAEDDAEDEGTYTPRPDELADLFEKLANPRVNPVARLACTLLICTAQRRRTVVSARVQDFDPWDMVEGWGLWRIPTRFMKGKREHVLPLPPRAWQAVQTAIAIAGASPWVFPQTQLRYVSDKGDKTISRKLLNDSFKKAGISWAPHDVRRALVALADRRGIPLPLLSVVIAHKPTDVPSVTVDNYGKVLEYKTDKHYVLAQWMDYLDECTRKYGKAPRTKAA